MFSWRHSLCKTWTIAWQVTRKGNHAFRFTLIDATIVVKVISCITIEIMKRFWIVIFVIFVSKRVLFFKVVATVLKCTVHCALSNRTYLGHQMSVPVRGPQISNEQLWTGLQWWPPDVSSGGRIPCLMSRWGSGARCACIVRSNASYGNGHMGTPLWADKHKWKHYLPSTSLAGSNKISKTFAWKWKYM